MPKRLRSHLRSRRSNRGGYGARGADSRGSFEGLALQGLEFGELLETVAAELAADAGALEAAEGRLQVPLRAVQVDLTRSFAKELVESRLLLHKHR